MSYSPDIATPLRSNGLLNTLSPSSNIAKQKDLERVTVDSENGDSFGNRGEASSLKKDVSMKSRKGQKDTGSRFKPVPSGNFYGPTSRASKRPLPDNKENFHSSSSSSSSPASFPPAKRTKISPKSYASRTPTKTRPYQRPVTPSNNLSKPTSKSEPELETSNEDELMRALLEGLDGEGASGLFSPSPIKIKISPRAEVKPGMRSTSMMGRIVSEGLAENHAGLVNDEKSGEEMIGLEDIWSDLETEGTSSPSKRSVRTRSPAVLARRDRKRSSSPSPLLGISISDQPLAVGGRDQDFARGDTSGPTSPLAHTHSHSPSRSIPPNLDSDDPTRPLRTPSKYATTSTSSSTFKMKKLKEEPLFLPSPTPSPIRPGSGSGSGGMEGVEFGDFGGVEVKQEIGLGLENEPRNVSNPHVGSAPFGNVLVPHPIHPIDAKPLIAFEEPKIKLEPDHPDHPIPSSVPGRIPKKEDIDALMAGLEEEFGVESWDVDGDVDMCVHEKAGVKREGGAAEGLIVAKGEEEQVVVKGKVEGEDAGPTEDARLALSVNKEHATIKTEEEIEHHASNPPAPMTPIKPISLHDTRPTSPNLFDDFPFDDDFGLDSPSPIKPPRSPQQPSAYPLPHPLIHPAGGLAPGEGVGTSWVRGVVNSVRVDEQEGQDRRFGWGEKIVFVKESKGGREVRVVLKDEYASLVVNAGDTVNLISPILDSLPPSIASSSRSNPSGLPAHPSTMTASLPDIVLSLRNPENHIVLHPDILVPMTTLAGSSNCLRKGVLQGMVKSGGVATTKPLLYGNIIHEILQDALQSRCFSSTALKTTLSELLLRSDIQLSLWSADLGYEEVRQEVWEKVEQALLTFGKKWVGAQPSEESVMHNSQKRLSLSGLHDVEESIWSVKWGLKGKVDASVQAVVEEERRKGVGHARGASKQGPMPFEIKTGRAIGVMDHRAQTMLYTLLMGERYRTPVDAGLLYYTQTDSMLQVPAAKGEIRSLLHTRNELAGYLARQRITRQQAINASQARRTQASQRETPASRDALIGPPSVIVSATPPPTSVLAVEDLPFLPATIDEPRTCKSCYSVDACMLYRRAVDSVETSDHDPIAETYQRKTGHLDAADGEFFTRWENLISIEEQDIVRFRNQLWTMTAAKREKSGRCFADMILLKDSVKPMSRSGKADVYTYKFVRNVSVDGSPHRSFLSGHIGKGDPVSLSIEPDLLSIARAFVLDLSPTEITLITDMRLDFSALLARAGRSRAATPVFRVDKDEMLSGTARMRNNLAQLFYAEDAGGDEKRRRLIVHLDPPAFDESYAPELEEIPSTLNVDQAEAMRKVLTARDYSLILGMPGTGKTTTIAEIIIALVARGKSVLLTSYTHSAVDTILMKLLNTEQKILRIGNIDKIHPDVAHLALERMGPATSLSQLDDRLMSPQIVATTCLSIDHPIFARRKFDYCIVDEASQITLPTCIGPLRFADTFVLVGDHFQLPPIVKNSEARRGGLDVSLFRLLSDSHPQAVVDLSYQYRMNADIMSLSNKLIYGDRLKCGSIAVAEQRLELPSPAKSVLGSGHRCATGSCWIEALLDPEVKAVFVDTDSVPAKDSRVGDLVQNEAEGKLIQQVASCLVKTGIHEEDIAVITPYRQQIKLLTRLLSDMSRIEVMTADKSQGRDKDCILISMVRSNDAGNIGELLRDWRRINVSFTRAKKKLIIFGSRHTLQSDRLLSDFFLLMEEKRWIYNLSAGAEKLHEELLPEPAIMSPAKASKYSSSAKGKMGAELLNARPFLRDALNDITNTSILRV